MKKFLKKISSLLILVFLTQVIQADEVTVSGRQILVNGNPYIIKGICYQPVPKGSTEIDYSTLTKDLALMEEAGINTIRVYRPIDDEAVLDEINAAGIKVIIGFGYNMEGYYDILSGSFINYIKKYKNHNAILMWEFGNEYNYHPEWFNNDITNWYTALNNAADEAFIEDQNHPTASAHGELPSADVLIKCPYVDVWGLNIYRWDNPGDPGNNLFSQWETLSNKPMYLSEAGGDRYMSQTMNGYEAGENEQAQADATRNILNSIFDNVAICSGVTLFEFCDEWWKADNPSAHDAGGSAPNSSGVPYDGAPNEEYWGIVDIDRNKTLAFEEVKTIYNGISVDAPTSENPSQLKFYPNPTTSKINFIASEEIDHIDIHDLTGKRVYFSIAKTKLVQVDVSQLANGPYIVSVKYKNGTLDISKIMKH